MRSLRVLVALAVSTLLLASVGAASAATFDGGLVGIGTGESSNPTSGFGHLDISMCVVGNIPVSQTETTYYRCTLEFDLDSMPANAVVSAAVLSIYTDPIDPCGSTVCGMVLSGYVGDAATTLGDLTAGSPIGEESMGTGAYSHFDVKNMVKSVLAGADLPIIGFNFAGDAQNPAGAWTVVGHPTSAHPPTLVITYAIPASVTVAVQAAGTGTVGAEGSSINCPGTCTDTYLPGATVKLHANPANGFAFSQWVGSPCAGKGSVCSFTMPNTAVSVTAVFVSTAPPSTGPTQPPKTQSPAHTTAPGEPTAVPATGAPVVSAAPATVEASTPAPTIIGLGDPNAQPAAAESGLPGILILVVVVGLLAAAIGFGVYKVAGSRAPKP